MRFMALAQHGYIWAQTDVPLMERVRMPPRGIIFILILISVLARVHGIVGTLAIIPHVSDYLPSLAGRFP